MTYVYFYQPTRNRLVIGKISQAVKDVVIVMASSDSEIVGQPKNFGYITQKEKFFSFESLIEKCKSEIFYTIFEVINT